MSDHNYVGKVLVLSDMDNVELIHTAVHNDWTVRIDTKIPTTFIGGTRASEYSAQLKNRLVHIETPHRDIEDLRLRREIKDWLFQETVVGRDTIRIALDFSDNISHADMDRFLKEIGG